MLRFDFNIVYVLGKNLVIADALSSAPLMAPDQQNKHFKEDVQAYVDAIIQGVPATEQRLEGIRLAQKMTHFVNKWPGTVKNVGQGKDELRA